MAAHASQDAATGRDQPWDDPDVPVDLVRNAVQQAHDLAVGRPGFDVHHLEHIGGYGLHRSELRQRLGHDGAFLR
jgi:hypothetical protein